MASKQERSSQKKVCPISSGQSNEGLTQASGSGGTKEQTLNGRKVKIKCGIPRRSLILGELEGSSRRAPRQRSRLERPSSKALPGGWHRSPEATQPRGVLGPSPSRP